MALCREYLTRLLLLLAISLTVARVNADDWPMWRYDAARSAASREVLPQHLTVLWKREFSSRQQAWDDPLNLDLMTYDRVFEPIVLDGRLIIPFNDSDKVMALDADDGATLWTAYAEAPVRLPPVGHQGRVYYCSDDGFLYCVDASNGKRLWKFDAAPNSQHAIGNRRLTSAWPARGGPVLRDGTIYFAGSIWPFMGTFIYALDAESGAVQWINDSTGAQYIKQPHSAPSFAGVAPQGPLVATEELLLVPGGRSVPAAFERRTGKLRYFELNAGGKGTGGSFVTADAKHFYVHTREKGTRAFNIESGVKTAFQPNEPVLAAGLTYSAESDGDKQQICAYDSKQEELWKIDADGRGDLILAGDKLYAAGDTEISVIRLPSGKRPPRVLQTIAIGAKAERLLAADGKLFAVTMQGTIIALGHTSTEVAAQVQPDRAAVDLEVSGPARTAASQLLASADAQGYAFWFGASDDARLAALIADSPFAQFAVVDDDANRVSRLQGELDAAKLLGRVTAHHSEAASFRPPQYVANVVFVGEDLAGTAAPQSIKKIYDSVRPYGGVMYLLADEKDRQRIASAIEACSLEQATVEITSQGVIVRRVGALPGAADWTHQYGDVANTLKSNDARVKLPLGILWFGGSSHMDVLPRHGHGPPEQVIGGRLFIQGLDCLSARDVYTGRVLWKRDFDNLGTHDVYYDDTFDDVPLDPKYNQVHIPGANGRGTNFVVTEDLLYILEGSVCHVIDPATGLTRHDIRIPDDETGPVNWGYIGVYKDVLIGGVGFAKYRGRLGLAFDESDKDLSSSRKGFGSKSLDRAGSRALIGFDRHTGEQRWRIDANHSFWHNGIVAGGEQIYCLDKNPSQIEQAMIRRGKTLPSSYRIVAIDHQTGNVNWEVKEGIFGTWLGYSERHDMLLQAGAKASDRLYAEVAEGMTVYNAGDGSVKWKNDSRKYAGPCILHNDLIITNANSYSESAGAFYLRDGKPKLVKNPLTGEMQPWKLTRAYGCNNIIASENMLTFRSGAAGFYDLLSEGGTGNLGGFKSGCTSNLVVAGGVLNAPDYTRTCSCAYQNQTSLALVHMPEIDVWSVNGAVTKSASGQSIKRLGINFGAPGDRRDDRGLLWLEHPVIAGDSAPLAIVTNSEATYFQNHSASVTASDLPWVLASGIEGVTDIHIMPELRDRHTLESGLPILDVKDDAEENEVGEVDRGNSALRLGEVSGNQIVGLRFNEINIARGTKIRGAHIQFQSQKKATKKSSLMITAEDSADAERFLEDSHDLSARNSTSQEVAWNPPAWEKVGQAEKDQRTPNLAKLVQAVINRPDWSAGNSIAFLFSGSGQRSVKSAKDGPDKAPRLVIDADLVLPAIDESKPIKRFDLRLFFAVPERHAGGRRVFDVYVEDKLACQNVTLDPNDSGKRYTTETVENVPIQGHLQIRLDPKEGSPVLSGLEIVRRED